MATSLLTNTAAMSALSSLTATQAQLSKTQAQVSSGLAIATASDNAAYWSIGQTMSAQVVGLKAVDRGLALTMSIADVTATALSSIKNSLDKMQADVVAAQQSGMSLSALQTDIAAQQQSIIAVSSSASFNGVNWLINKVASDSTYDSVGATVTPETDYMAIGKGQSPNTTAVYDLTTTSGLTRTEGGVSKTLTTTTHSQTTLTDGQDGKLTISKTSDPAVVSGDVDGLGAGSVAIPVSYSSTGIVTSNFSLSPLTLYSTMTGTTETSLKVSFAGTEDQAISSQSGPYNNSSADSYDGYGSVAVPGILDGVMYLQDGATMTSPPLPSTPSNSPPQTSFQFDPTGGSVYTSQSGSSGASGSVGSVATRVRKTILTMDISSASPADLKTIGLELQDAIAGIVGASTAVGALQTRIGNQQTFNASLSDALTSGIGSLVDADMNVASTRLQALQTQQQLGIQALSMANQNSQLLLKLFQAA